MKNFYVVCFPTVTRFGVSVEADSIEEAITEAQDIANRECGWYANESDVREIK